MERVWYSLIKEAKKKINVHEIPPFIEYGNNSCALLTDSGSIYTGVSVKSNSSINNSAEKSAVINMLNNSETTITKMVILNELEELITPSIDCLEYLLDLSASYGDIEILVNYDTQETKKLIDLLPDWWGTYRNKK
ncbi:MAG: cytidine deaminase [Bacilli bacterium]|nr:cytidine deaminase [Bacilli bacterium]